MEILIEFFTQHKKIIISSLAIILLLIVCIACYDRWTEIWYDFGRNLYYFFH